MRIVFMGTAAIAQPSFEWLLQASGHEVAGLVCQPDKPVGRRQVVTPPPLKRVAEAHGVPVFQPERIRHPEAVETVLAWRPDVVIVMAYGQILPEPLLFGPPHGCINLHASILPAHRGASPVHAAILAGDAESGITAMQMDAGMDTGDILHIERLALHRRETAASLHDRLAARAPKALAATLDHIRLGTLCRTPQDPTLATYAPKLNRESGRIDWHRDWLSLDRQVRGLHPWPGAFTSLPSCGHPPKKLKVHAALPSCRYHGTPGEILRVSPRGILVACGKGALLLRHVQPEGGRTMHAADFLHGHALAPGQSLA